MNSILRSKICVIETLCWVNFFVTLTVSIEIFFHDYVKIAKLVLAIKVKYETIKTLEISVISLQKFS